MIHSISGKLIIKKPQFAVIEASGIGFKILISSRTFRQLPKTGRRVKIFCHLWNYENNIALYGFLKEKELQIFELLNSINGIGPKAALRILNVMKPDNLLGAVKQGRSDLLVKAAGVGIKKAARIILELKDKISRHFELADSADLESDLDLERILKSLGYKQNEIKDTLRRLPAKAETLEEKLKAAFKILGKQ